MTKNFFVVGLPDNLLICLAFFGIAQRRGPLPELVGPFSPSSSPKLVNVTKNHDICIFGVIFVIITIIISTIIIIIRLYSAISANHNF